MNTHPGTKNKILILNLSIQINLVHLGLEYSFKSQFFAHLSSIFASLIQMEVPKGTFWEILKVSITSILN